MKDEPENSFADSERRLPAIQSLEQGMTVPGARQRARTGARTKEAAVSNRRPTVTALIRRLSPILLVLVGLLLAACGGGDGDGGDGGGGGEGVVDIAKGDFKVGILNYGFDEVVLDGFKAGMAELGYVEGQNIEYIYQQSVASLGRLGPSMTYVMREDPDVVFAIDTPAAIRAQVKTVDDGGEIPVVFAEVFDPVGNNLLQNPNAPEGNVTGVQIDSHIPAMLDLVKELVPGVTRLYVPSATVGDEAFESLTIAEMEKLARDRGIELVIAKIPTSIVPSRAQIVGLVEAEAEQGPIDGLFVPALGLRGDHLTAIIESAIALKLPLVAGVETHLSGSLLSYGVDQPGMGRQASKLVDRLLKGATVAEVPVETAPFFLGVNLQTAEAIGLDISDAFLEKADQIVILK